MISALQLQIAEVENAGSGSATVSNSVFEWPEGVICVHNHTTGMLFMR